MRSMPRNSRASSAGRRKRISTVVSPRRCAGIWIIAPGGRTSLTAATRPSALALPSSAPPSRGRRPSPMGLKRALRRWYRGRKARLSPRQRLEGFAAWQKFNAPSERTRRLFEELAKDVQTDTKFTFLVSATLERLDETLESLIGQSYRNFEIV